MGANFKTLDNRIISSKLDPVVKTRVGKRNKNPGRINFKPRWLGMNFLLGGGFHIIRQPIKLESHSHPGWEMTYLAEGEVSWQTDTGKSLKLHGGEFALTQANVKHSGEMQIIQPCTLFWLILSKNPGDYRQSAMDKNSVREFHNAFQNAGNSVFRASPDLCRIFNSLQAELANRNKQTNPLDNAWQRAIILQIIIAAVRSMRSSQTETGSEITEKAKSFMTANLEKNIGVSDIAEAVGLSNARFSELFKAKTGLTPADCLRRLRCQKASQYLRNSQINITQIAFKCGFQSSQYFAQVFKKYYAQSPEQYRKQTRIK